MKKAVLFISSQNADIKPAPALFIHWEKRDVPKEHISLPQVLDQHLLDIRAEHMHWAYETGFLPLSLPFLKDKTLAHALQCGAHLSMWWTSIIYERHPKLSPNLYIIYKLRALELLLRQEGCEELEIHGGDRLLRASLCSICKVYGIKFSYIGEDENRAATTECVVKKIYSLIPAPFRAIIRYCHWWWTIRRHLPYISNKFPANEKTLNSHLPATITTYFPNIDLKAVSEGRFRSRYWESLHDALNLEAERENPDGPHFVRWLFIRFPSPQLSFAQCLTLRDIFNKSGKDGSSFHYLEEFLTVSDICTAFLRWFRLSIVSTLSQRVFARACHFKDSKMNFWIWLRGEWAESFRGWRCLERSLQNLAFIRYCKMAGKQRWYLFPLENCPWERMLTMAAHDAESGPVFGSQHSIIRPTDFRYFDDPRTFTSPGCEVFQPDIIGGNGASALQQWGECGLPPSRMQQLEALRYLYLAEQKSSATDFSNLPPEPGEPLEVPARNRMLVLTSFFADETRAHLELLEESLKGGVLKDWHIAIKPHPYLSVDNWLENLPSELSANIRITNGPLALELRKGYVVWASNSTTASLEAVLMGLPVMVMRPCNDFDLCPIQNVPGLARTGTVAEVTNCLVNLTPLYLTPDYLDLNPALTEWRRLLNLS